MKCQNLIRNDSLIFAIIFIFSISIHINLKFYLLNKIYGYIIVLFFKQIHIS